MKYTTGDYTVDEKHRGVALTEEGVLTVRETARRSAICTTRSTSNSITTSSRRSRRT